MNPLKFKMPAAVNGAPVPSTNGMVNSSVGELLGPGLRNMFYKQYTPQALTKWEEYERSIKWDLTREKITSGDAVIFNPPPVIPEPKPKPKCHPGLVDCKSPCCQVPFKMTKALDAYVCLSCDEVYPAHDVAESAV